MTSPATTPVADDQPTVDELSAARLGIFGQLIYGLAWLVTLTLVVVGLLRILDHDGANLLIWLNAFTRYVYLPAYACIAWAIWKRRWVLATANVAIIALHIALLAPDFVRDRRFDQLAVPAPANAAASPTVRIFFANVRAYNIEHQAMLDEIKAADPDIIVLVEFAYSWHMAFLHAPFFTAYPYGHGLEAQPMGTVNIFSRIPLKTNGQTWFAGRALQSFDISGGAKTLRIIALHSPRPQKLRDDNYDGFWNDAVPMLLSQKGPVVVVGDFNATQYSSVYEKLTADRFRSAHQDRGQGYETSWPNGQFWLPSLIRIDQALISPEVECVSIKQGIGLGSDHKPFVLDVEIRPLP